MATSQRAVLDVVLARLRALPALVDNRTDRIRIAHRTPVTRAETPSIYIVPHSIEPRQGDGDCVRRRLTFSVRVYGRDDGGVAAIDELLEQVLLRLQPAADDVLPYPTGIVVDEPTRVRFDEEDADEDGASADLEFAVTYTSPAWTL